MASEGLFGKTYRIESARLKEWDYSSPVYYLVTICTKDKQSFFGDIVEIEEEPGAAIQLSPAGQVIGNSWKMIPRWYPNVSLDEWQIMPNHFHGILFIEEQKEGVMLGLIINGTV